MRTAAALIFCACAAGAHAGFAGPADPNVDAFLTAIRQVESGGRYDCPRGRFGEEGPYQFRRETWRQYTSEPFNLARTAYADEVAAAHYSWLVERLEAAQL